MIKDEYIINPDEYLMPSYRISPFRTDDIIKNRNLKINVECDNYFNKRFVNKKYIYTINGRQAINIALSKLNIKSEECITILTTTNNFYISGCVTKEIENFCMWSRKIEKNTKAILVNHEFGFPYEELRKLKKYNLPIIEDCAYSFYSNNEEQSVGQVGDFIIYSLPKYFPIQIGGLLVYNKNYNLDIIMNEDEKLYIKKVLSYYINRIQEWSVIRRENYKYLDNLLALNGIETRFKLTNRITPGVYMFKVDDDVDTNLFKKFLWRQGIQCSIFYKEKVLFIPIHNRLVKDDLDYFAECIALFLNQKG